MNRRIYITAVIKVKPGYRDKVLETLKNMVQNTRKEQDCIQYDLHEDMEDENVFVFYEIWKHMDGLLHHNLQPYINEFHKMVVKGYVTETKIYKTKKV